MAQTTTTEAPRLLTLERAAERVDPPIPLGTLRHWIATGRLRAHRPGRRVLICADHLDAFLRGEPEPKREDPLEKLKRQAGGGR